MKYQNKRKPIYIFSGIEPSKKGAGKFLSYFTEVLKEYNNVKLIYIKTPNNLFVWLLKKTKYFQKIKEFYYLYKRRFFLQTEIINSTIVLFHPQSLGLKNSINLIKKNRKIFIYVLDNFFFCKKSYNHLPNANHPCILCLQDTSQSLINNCPALPNLYSHAEYISFLTTLAKNKRKIIFLTQNDNQSLMLYKKYGNEINLKKIGMFTGEFELKDYPKQSESYEYDFLYHNTLAEAKGLKYFVEIVRRMPEYKFVIPYKKSEVEKIVDKIDCGNIYFKSCSWGNGLLDLILKTNITIVPSLWSAPIEGALVKSLFFSNAVALIPQKFSFSEEIPPDIYISLNIDISIAVKSLKSAIQNKTSLNKRASKFMINFIKSNINLLNDFSKELSLELSIVPEKTI